MAFVFAGCLKDLYNCKKFTQRLHVKPIKVVSCVSNSKIWHDGIVGEVVKIVGCALCHQIRPLHKSHFLPKALYRLMRHSDNGNENPVLISAGTTIQVSHQMMQHLLCGECEDLFSKNGESYVQQRLSSATGFPFYDRLRLALPLCVGHDHAAFRCPTVGFDGDRIAYFGLSILWRAAVRSWRTFDNGTTGVTIDPTFLESIRQYLLGATCFPQNLSVVTTVATDFMSQNSCFVPAPVKDSPFTTYSLLTKGLYFRFILGVPKLSDISIAGGGLDLIFTRDCSDNSTSAFLRMMKTTVIKGSLLRTA